MKNSLLFIYHIIPSAIGEVGLVRRTAGGPLQRIFLPRKSVSMRDLIGKDYPGAVVDTGGGDAVCMQLQAYLAGLDVAFSLADLDFAGISGFTRRVLTADQAIPRGRVATYGGLAARLGVPGGGRAVGNVMARNPFPLIIPCHRVVGSDGGLHGFGGGLPMKRMLLTMEGVAFDGKGRVLPEHVLSEKNSAACGGRYEDAAESIKGEDKSIGRRSASTL
jgi:methylated-DNA-[protein]-cysteine S-methyltransferase